VLPVAIAGVAAWKRIESAESALAAKQILTAALVLDEPGMPGQRISGKRSVLGKISNLGAAKTAPAPNDEERTSRFLSARAELVERLRAEPGVIDVVFASNAPGGEATTRMAADTAPASTAATDAVAKPDPSGAVVGATRVDLRYFAAFGIPILAGRAFQPGDVSTSPSVVIVNRSFVRRVFENGNPLGRRIRMLPVNRGPTADALPQSPWEEIVGIVPDFPVDSTTPTPKIYRPLYQANSGPVTIALRLKGIKPTAFANQLRELTVATNPMLRLENIRSLEQTLEDDSAGRRLTILALELVTLSTVLLSAAGIYALLSFTITRRRREIGIRAALGAGPRQLLSSVLSRVTVQVATGIVLGIAVAALLDHMLNGGWTGRRATLVLPGVVALMAAIGLLAAVRPARQALRIQPTEALRSE
jgi:putative ABC transport system permease protein